jgi:hypothetical protein
MNRLISSAPIGLMSFDLSDDVPIHHESRKKSADNRDCRVSRNCSLVGPFTYATSRLCPGTVPPQQTETMLVLSLTKKTDPTRAVLKGICLPRGSRPMLPGMVVVSSLQDRQFEQFLSKKQAMPSRKEG